MSGSEKSPHSGHRDRVRARYLKEGLDSFEQHNILELLLFYSIPQRDTNELAHRLIERFGSLKNVFSAEHEELISVKGITTNTAVLIKLIPDIARQCEIEENCGENRALTTSALAGNFVCAQFRNLKNEAVMLICLDSRGRPFFAEFVFRGTVTYANISVRMLAETALRKGAAGVMLAHNHPNGTLSPSADDVIVTASLRDALRTLEIHFTDHIICSGKNYYSMASDADYSNMFDR